VEGWATPVRSAPEPQSYTATDTEATTATCSPACPGDVSNLPSITFTGSGAGITADAINFVTNTALNPFFDQIPNFGGLGINIDGDDQVKDSGQLHLHFNSPVILTGIGTLFDPNHTPFGSGVSCTTSCTVSAGTDFLFSTDGTTFSSVLFSDANNTNNSFGGPAGSTDFYFRQDGANNPEFYVSALTYNPVPGPIVGAGLPGLIAACGGLLTLARRRRKLVA
jgi:hypothetical protein